VLVVEAAIGSEPGSVDLVDEGNGSWAVQTRRAVDGGVAVVTVPELVARCGEGAELFIVKVDIEGFESDLFAANLEWLDQAAAVMIEPHDWLLPGSGTSTDFQKAMAERGFDLLISGENLLYVRRV
jgi:FkbM family methyltransferase